MRLALHFKKYVVVLGLVLAGRAFAAGPTVDVTMVPDVSAAEPGKPFRVAIIVTPEAGWHVYWKNPGDAGLPTKAKWNLPEGFVAGSLTFPLPVKIVQPGNIVAYGYEGETVFVTTITPPKELKAGTTVSLKANISWLCCKEECMPGHQAVEISLPVADQAAPANGDVFAKAQAAMPADSPPTDVVTSTKVEATKGDDGDLFTLQIAWKQAVTNVDMFPTNITGLDVSGINVAANGTETQISFKGRVMAGQKLAVEEMPVLVVYTDVNGRRHGFYAPVNLSALSSDIH